MAQFLPPGRLAFDLIVIDEASQITPEDALGAVARAKQVVVVGDDKQLPPTNFFRIINAGNDEEEGEDVTILTRPDRPSDFESSLRIFRAQGACLNECSHGTTAASGLSLIALSNHECYGGPATSAAKPVRSNLRFRIILVQTARGHYDRGGTSRDLVQAADVTTAIAEHIRVNSGRSLGIACLSVQQRDAVDDMIDKGGIRSDVEAFAPKGERLFVKNLEAVQGDERDVIFISVGYGVAPGQSRPFL